MHEPTFLILTALASGPLHGYAILSEVETISDGASTLRVGTLYAALDRLAGEGHVEVHREDIVNGRLRRTYRLTATGHAALSAEAEKMRLLGARAKRRLAVHPFPNPTAEGAR